MNSLNWWEPRFGWGLPQEAFGYSYAWVADILRSRMLDQLDDVVCGFAEACRRGGIDGVQAALDADAVAVCDGGGLLPAAMDFVNGAEDVAQLVAVALCGQPDTELTVEAVNGRAGLALRRAGHAVAVVGVEAAEGKVIALWIVLNPAKLRGWHRPSQSVPKPLE